MSQFFFWVGFHVLLGGMLALDLGVFNRKARVVGVREALAWAGVWIGTALLFDLGIYWLFGSKPAYQFLTAYLIEKSLSVDNVFVFAMVFSYFGVPPVYQHRVLFWGILGALVARLAFILAGVAAIKALHWVIYVLGAFLVFTGLRMAFQKGRTVHPERNPVFMLFRPVLASGEYERGRFFARDGGRLRLTPLLVVLLVVESNDVIFAVDSVPAVLSITLDPFIAYTSNVLAILGLRSLYFVIGGMMGRFRYLHYGLAAILVFVGAKMLVSEFYQIAAREALPVVAVILCVSVVVSIVKKSGNGGEHGPTRS